MRAAMLVVVGFVVCSSMALGDVAMQWAAVGNPGNAPDAAGAGAVASMYFIGKYEVTNSQYADFLNAKAAADPLALYNANMGSNVTGGIVRSGASGSYAYAVKSGYENQPVVYVGWYDAVRFSNWMNNGRGNGDTESGAYTLLGAAPVPSNASSIVRNAGAKVFLPTLDEWYKAAYHQPASAGGDADSYWTYPTRTNIAPHSDQPPGAPAIANNVANCYRNEGGANGYDDGYAVTGSTVLDSSVNYLTAMGAFSESGSYYGTFDQGGNVNEWLEAISAGPFHANLKGGSWMNNFGDLGSKGIYSSDRPTENTTFGFRVAGTVPEPGAGAGVAIMGAGLLARRSRIMPKASKVST